MNTGKELHHEHEWFRTGAMGPGVYRCITCGQWATEKITSEREVIRQLVEALTKIDELGMSQFFTTYDMAAEAQTIARSALAAAKPYME